MKTFVEDGIEKVNLSRLDKEDRNRVWQEMNDNNSVLLDLFNDPIVLELQSLFGKAEVIVNVNDIKRARNQHGKYNRIKREN